MAKIKLTKGELKRQRDSLAQFRHYLPTLQLKKQQLQMKITEAHKLLEEKEGLYKEKLNAVDRWKGLLADPGVNLKEWITPERIETGTLNIAGANIPVYERIRFKEAEYDLYATPFWVDRGLEELKALTTFLAEIAILKRRVQILNRELRVTTQRVNLFEKIKIPECLENIRVIRIYLGDQQANAVGVSKVAKKKIETNEELVQV
jgi:V/A-type H+-transporting ATPase subunit D